MSQNSLGGGNQIQYNLPTTKLETLWVPRMITCISSFLIAILVAWLFTLFLFCSNLAGNQFGGNIPYSIFSMSNLKNLYVPVAGFHFPYKYV
jgi:uncharacterized protein (DUF486 family)